MRCSVPPPLRAATSRALQVLSSVSMQSVLSALSPTTAYSHTLCDRQRQFNKKVHNCSQTNISQLISANGDIVSENGDTK